MTSGASSYLLECGCTDWCNCPRCLTGTDHEQGTAWGCLFHGVTTVTRRAGQVMTGDKQVSFPVATVGCPESFTLGPAHQMRSAPCLACREPVGGEPVTVIGVAALAGPACECGGVVSDVFLVHASHLPLPQLKLQAMIQHALGCALPH